MKAPANIRRLPTRGKLPVPWFVKSPDDFRVMDDIKQLMAIEKGLCWVCGRKLARLVAFTGGIKSYTNRLYADPPAHPECAVYSCTICPFLASPEFVRRGNDISYPIALDINPIDEAHILIVKRNKYQLTPDGILRITGKEVDHIIFEEGTRRNQ